MFLIETSVDNLLEKFNDFNVPVVDKWLDRKRTLQEANCIYVRSDTLRWKIYFLR